VSQRQRILLVLVLLFSMVLMSALTLIYTKHQSRKMFVELQQAKHEVDALDAQWSQLQLEQSAWSGHGRIERKARQEIGMFRPKPEDVIFVRLP